MQITGGLNISGAFTVADTFPIATANTSVVTQTKYTGTSITFSPFTSVIAGVPPYTYSNVGVLPVGMTLYSGNGIVTGTPTVAANTSVTFRVADSAGTIAGNTVTVGFNILVVPTYTVNYLVVAGGGGSQSYGGQAATGGAGGGGVLYSSLTATGGTTYTITIGSGGAKDVVALGSPSSFIGGAANVYAYGGDYGYYQTSPFNGTGGSGSGGQGGSAGLNPGTFPGGLARGSPSAGVAGSQGYPGGLGRVNTTWPNPAGLYFITAGGGGGGAGGAGNAGSASPSGASGGPGGSGYTWPYTNNTYAGGGGAGAANGNPSPGPATGGSGGAGGGGAGVASNGATAGSGAANTGGGAGGTGGPSSSATGGAGGSGVVILAVPTAAYPGSAPGATVSTPPAAPGQTVLRYATSGTYTA